MSDKEPDKKPEEENIVESIFDHEAKDKKPSTLFTSTTKPVDGQNAESSKEEPSASTALRASPKSLTTKLVQGKAFPVGIDIGYNSVKIAQLAANNQKVEIEKLILKELPFDLIEDPELRRQQLPNYLKRILQDVNVSGPAFSMLPTSSVKMKNITLPQMPENELEGAINWEIKQSIGEKADQFSYDYLILDDGKSEGSDKVEALSIVCSREDIMAHLDLLETAGLKPKAVETESVSLISGLNFNMDIPKDEIILLLDLGGQATKLNIIRNSIVSYSRILNTDGNSLTTAIRDYCRVSFKEAEHYKRNYGKGNQPDLMTTDALQIKNAITLLLEKLVSDIDHTFKFYSYQLTKSVVRKYDRVILTGGTANFHIITPFLRDRLDVPVETYNPLDAFEITKDTQLVVNDLKEDSIRFGVALGLALRAVE